MSNRNFSFKENVLFYLFVSLIIIPFLAMLVFVGQMLVSFDKLDNKRCSYMELAEQVEHVETQFKEYQKSPHNLFGEFVPFTVKKHTPGPIAERCVVQALKGKGYRFTYNKDWSYTIEKYTEIEK